MTYKAVLVGVFFNGLVTMFSDIYGPYQKKSDCVKRGTEMLEELKKMRAPIVRAKARCVIEWHT